MAAPQFNVFQFSAPDKLIGAQSVPVPCVQGDFFIFTATIQYISGGMQPFIAINFMDAAQTTVYGTIQVPAILTDNGWHIATLSGTAPANSRVAVVVTQCAYIPSDFGIEREDSTGVILAENGSIILQESEPLSVASQTLWATSDYRLMQNGQAVYAPLSQFSNLLTAYSLIQQFIYPLYYLSLFTSEYRNAPNLYAFAATLLQPFMDLFAMTQQLWQAFALPATAASLQLPTQAQGAQLDIIGTIVGASRLLPFQPTGYPLNVIAAVVVSNVLTLQVIIPSSAAPLADGQEFKISGMSSSNNTWLNGQTVTVSAFGLVSGVIWDLAANVTHSTYGNTADSGTATQTGGPGIPSAVMDDTDYLTLIEAKIAQNQFNGQVDNLYALWNALFPSGKLIFIDNQNMTCDIILVGTFTPLQYQMIINGMIVPRPQGVLYTYENATLPIFGFSGDGTIIGGFNQGMWY